MNKRLAKRKVRNYGKTLPIEDQNKTNAETVILKLKLEPKIVKLTLKLYLL